MRVRVWMDVCTCASPREGRERVIENARTKSRRLCRMPVPLPELVPVPRPCLCWCLRLRLRLRLCLCPCLCENRRSPTSRRRPGEAPAQLNCPESSRDSTRQHNSTSQWETWVGLPLQAEVHPIPKMYMLELFCCAQWTCLVTSKMEQRGGEVGAPCVPTRSLCGHSLHPPHLSDEGLLHHPE